MLSVLNKYNWGGIKLEVSKRKTYSFKYCKTGTDKNRLNVQPHGNIIHVNLIEKNRILKNVLTHLDVG